MSEPDTPAQALYTIADNITDCFTSGECGNVADGLYHIADAIKENAKAIHRLAEAIEHSKIGDRS